MQQELVRGERWVIDGNYGGTMDIRLDAADTIIMFDFPRMLCLGRAVKRVIRYWGRSRPDNAVGCPERIDPEFLMWIWNYRAKRRPGIMQKLKEYEGKASVIILRNPGEADRLLKGLEVGRRSGDAAA